MARTVICKFITGNSASLGAHNTMQSAGMGVVSIVEIYRYSGGPPRRMVISHTRDLMLNFGDRIKCIQGRVGVLINPGTNAGMFVLYPNIPSCTIWNSRTELVINDETTKPRNRAYIPVFGNDIGTTNTAAGSFSR